MCLEYMASEILRPLQAVFMNKSRAIQHWVDRLGLDRQAALTKWDEQVKVAKYSNNNGPVGQTLQIPVKV